MHTIRVLDHLVIIESKEGGLAKLSDAQQQATNPNSAEQPI